MAWSVQVPALQPGHSQATVQYRYRFKHRERPVGTGRVQHRGQRHSSTCHAPRGISPKKKYPVLPVLQFSHGASAMLLQPSTDVLPRPQKDVRLSIFCTLTLQPQLTLSHWMCCISVHVHRFVGSIDTRKINHAYFRVPAGYQVVFMIKSTTVLHDGDHCSKCQDAQDQEQGKGASISLTHAVTYKHLLMKYLMAKHLTHRAVTLHNDRPDSQIWGTNYRPTVLICQLHHLHCHDNFACLLYSLSAVCQQQR